MLTPVSKTALPAFASWSVNETADIYELTRDGECIVFDRHLGTPPLQFVKNIITAAPNKINYIIPNNRGVIRNNSFLQIFRSFR